MKKALRFILAGVVALLAVSCYDDSALQEKVDKLDGRLTAVENTLNQEVADLAALVSQFKTLEGKVAAIKVETKDGLTTLTLSNGSSVVLSKDGVLTMVDGGWATVAPNGDVTPLNIPVSQKLKFIVEGNILKVSYDDGKTYESTGVEVAEPTAHVIGNIVVAEDGKSVAITIGDNTLSLPLVSSAVATLGLGRDNFFLRYDAEKEVEITAEGLEEVYVMNEPDGWRASIDGNVLTIESPTKKAVDADAAAAEGLVLVHATTAEGKCVVAKLEVSTGKGLVIEANNTALTITNAYSSVAYDYWGEPMGYSFTNFAIGIVPASLFVEDPAAYIAALTSGDYPGGELGFMYNNYNFEFTPYEEGVYEIDVIDYSVEELCSWLLWDSDLYPTHDVEVGVPYAIWIAPVNSRGEADASLVEYVLYTKKKVDSEISEISHKDALLSLDLAGAEKYFVGLVSEAELNMYEITLEEYMSQSAPWSYMVNGYTDYIEQYYEDGQAQVYMSLINGYGDTSYLQAGAKYYYWVVPYDSGVVYNDYASQFAPYVKEFATTALTLGDVQLSVEKTTESYYNLAATVTVADSTTVYYDFYTSEEWAEFDEEDDAILAALLGMSNYNDPLTETAVVQEKCEPGQTVICAAVAVSEAGVRSEVATVSFQAPAIVKNQATMSLKALLSTATGYKAVVNVEGAAKVAGFNVTDSSRDYWVSSMTKEIANNSATTNYQWVDVVDGVATIEFPLNEYKKDYFVMAYNADADGNLVDISEVFVFNIAENVSTFDLEK